MCGIVGYVGNNNSKDILISGLKKLEYRGYDSAGIALQLNDGIAIFKDVGKVESLENKIPNFYSKIGVGHTRWATNGVVNDINAHPHFSSSRRFCIVHNGVIENDKELKDIYLKDYKFVSDTDTEILINLIEKLYQIDMLTTLKHVKPLLKGSFSFLILDETNLDVIYFMKNQTPLLIGVGDEENIIASDSLAFPKNIDKLVLLNDGDYGYINSKTINLFNKDNISIKPIFSDRNKNDDNVDKDIYSHHMLKEIFDQPTMVETLINKYTTNDSIIFNSSIKDKIDNCDKIFIIACGSSYYSGLIGKRYLEKYLKKDVDVLLGSECISHFPLTSKNPLFIFVSQSGETLDVLNVVKQCKLLNYPSIGITNSPNSSICHLCDAVLYLYAGREISVASTKAFLGQSIMFYLLSQINSNKENLRNELNDFTETIKSIFDKLTLIESIAHQLKNYKDVFILGRDIDYVIALESALKLKEIAYIHAEAFPSGELKHGPIALLDESVAVIGISSKQATSSSLRVNLKECEVRKANIFTFSTSNVSQNDDTLVINYINSNLNPLLIVIVTQLLSFYIAKLKGNDIDMPRNLAKSVTVE